MPKINRYSGNLESFASQADTNQRTTFGTENLGDNTLDGNINSFYLTGWQIVGPNEKPTLQDFNAAFFTIGRLMAYVHQVGMPEWNGQQEYHANSMVNRSGRIYTCLTSGHISTTPPESDPANWNGAPGFDGSLTSNGWERLPSGRIDQWGLTQQIPAASWGTVNFPTPFSTECFNLSVTYYNPNALPTAGNPFNAAIIDNNSFRIYNGGSSLASYYFRVTGV